MLWAERAPLHKFLLLMGGSSTFDVLDGPLCTDWQLAPVVWKVSVRGDEGFVAEPPRSPDAPPLFEPLQP